MPSMSGTANGHGEIAYAASGAETLTRIYVAPTAKSLNGFKQICEDDNTCRGITELVFISHVVSGLFLSDSYQHEGDFMAAVEKDYGYFPSSMPEDFVFNTKNLSKSFKFYRKLVETYMYDEKQTDDILSQCLPKFSNLHMVVIAMEVDKPGLNDEWCFYTNYCNNNETEQGTSNPCETLAICCIHLSEVGIDKLIRQLSTARIPISRLEFQNRQYTQFSYDLGGVYNPVPEKSFHAIARNLTHLSISVGNNHFDQKDCLDGSDLWRPFLKAASCLTNLRIYPDQGSQEKGNILTMVLDYNTYANLSTFEIIRKLDDPSNVRAVSLNGFLRRHSKTLRHVQLSGVLLINWYAPGDTRDMMRESLKYVKSTLQLQTATALLQRRDAHSASVHGRQSTCTRCDGRCKKYRWVWGEHGIPVEELDDLAKDLQVALKGDQWDFGEFLMR